MSTLDAFFAVRSIPGISNNVIDEAAAISSTLPPMWGAMLSSNNNNNHLQGIKQFHIIEEVEEENDHNKSLLSAAPKHNQTEQ